MGDVENICWACGGTGLHVRSAHPLRFKPCWMCDGSRGFAARRRATKDGEGE